MKESTTTAFWKIQYDSASRAIMVTIRGSLDLRLARQMAVETLTAAIGHRAESFLADSRKMSFSLSSGFDALSLPQLLLANAPRSHRCMAIVHAPCPEAPNIFHFVEGMYRQAGYHVRFFTELEEAKAWLIARPAFAIKPEICPPVANDSRLNRFRTRQLWQFRNKNNTQHARLK